MPVLSERWNSLYFTFDDQNGEFPIRNMEISIFRLNHWFFGYWNMFSVMFLSLCLAHVHVQACVCITCVCGWGMVLGHCRHRDEGQRTWDMEQEEERHKASTALGRLAHASVWCPCPGQQWRKDGQGQLLTVGLQICNYINRHKQAHNFCCVILSVCVVKQG